MCLNESRDTTAISTSKGSSRKYRKKPLARQASDTAAKRPLLPPLLLRLELYLAIKNAPFSGPLYGREAEREKEERAARSKESDLYWHRASD